jgi:Leucine Rich repeat
MHIRWSVRSTLLFVLAVAIALAVIRVGWIEPLRRQAREMAAIQSHATVSGQLLNVPAQIPKEPASPFRDMDEGTSEIQKLVAKALSQHVPDSWDTLELVLQRSSQIKRPAQSPQWDQLRSVFAGSDSVNQEVIAICFNSPGATDDDLAMIARISTVQQLDLTHVVTERKGSAIHCHNGGAPHVTDKGIKAIATLPHLLRLNVYRSQITDQGCIALSESKSLITLGADETAITDEGLRALAKIPSLRRLGLQSTKITPAGIEEFKRLRPDIAINGR